ncbi:hypothetical protein MHYP_G00273920 [Metynnis hypsauchen]
MICQIGIGHKRSGSSAALTMRQPRLHQQTGRISSRGSRKPVPRIMKPFSIYTTRTLCQIHTLLRIFNHFLEDMKTCTSF